MNRFYYSVLLTLILPLVPVKLWWRGIKQPAYRQHWGERFGFYNTAINKPLNKPIIWLHCVSVGETRAAEPLIKALQATYPNHQILLTHGTPTGREAGEALFGNNVNRVYLPYDVPFAVNRFLARFKPSIALIMETELWFNLIAACKQRHIPVLLLNARLSEKSAYGYAKLGNLVQEGLQNLTAVAAQTSDDAVRLKNLGAQNISVAGNLKFDVTASKENIDKGLQLKKQCGDRPVFLAASTREGEEALILDALSKINMPNLLTILVPRHPQRFDTVAALLEQRGINFQRKTLLNNDALLANVRVVLGDTMGEMAMYYAVCDIAFVGGSLLNFGGQNLIEAAYMGKPILIGEHTFNFAEASNNAVTAGAAIRVKDADDLMQKVNELLKSKTKLASMQQATLRFSATYTGATVRLMALIKQYI